MQKLGVRTHQVKIVEKAMRLAYEDAKSAGSHRFVSVDVHSRGGTTAKAAINNLPDEVVSKLFVGTYGSASLINDSKTAGSMNYISTRDFVPFIASPVGYCKAWLFGNPCVEFLPSEKNGIDHGFHDQTYQGGLFRSSLKYLDLIHEAK